MLQYILPLLENLYVLLYHFWPSGNFDVFQKSLLKSGNKDHIFQQKQLAGCLSYPMYVGVCLFGFVGTDTWTLINVINNNNGACRCVWTFAEWENTGFGQKIYIFVTFTGNQTLIKCIETKKIHISKQLQKHCKQLLCEII